MQRLQVDAALQAEEVVLREIGQPSAPR